ncbi:hypothetical protein POM88_029322 [Heracleum sosnowskyi]|uniref:Glucose-methanol-choline oxidoreductase C-terminal domain-containing protein n=1 Tax=Heracleum sosnowskyi TaxID=360622 RepID=A0AAD8MHK4_9APIA|nr:hypothetical protein POM88_029322 [Heracleum sosnowskyi]
MSIRGAVSHLEELGCSVTEVSLPSFSLGLPAYYILSSSESSSNLSRYDGVRYGNQCESEELNSLYENTRARGFGSESQRLALSLSLSLSLVFRVLQLPSVSVFLSFSFVFPTTSIADSGLLGPAIFSILGLLQLGLRADLGSKLGPLQLGLRASIYRGHYKEECKDSDGLPGCVQFFDGNHQSSTTLGNMLDFARMVHGSVLNDALKSLFNAEKKGKREVMIRPSPENNLNDIFKLLVGYVSAKRLVARDSVRRDAIEAYKRNKRNFPREVFNGGFILEKIASPKSTGQLSLSNTNVDDNPNVSFNYFSHPEDVQKCVEGIRLVEKLLASKHLTNYMSSDDETFEKLLNLSVRANFNFIPKHTNDTKSVEQFCKDTVITIWHYHGGCHVGKVVSPDYEVLGVQRLRVIDGSTFSLSPGTNPQGTLLMMGRYMGLKMLRQRLGRAAGF